MIRYKVLIAYDGTDFAGWQVQPDHPSIAQTMQDSFARVFDKKISLVGASRTDAGVHALGQVAKFETNLGVDPQILQWAWNNALPPSIVIRTLELVPPQFHPFYNILDKTYFYHFFLERPLPFIQRYGWYYWYKVDLQKLQEVLQLFIGTHNFRAFSTGEPIGGDPLCTVDAITLEQFKRFGVFRISMHGQRFLRHMVRRLVGAALSAATEKNDVSLSDVLEVMMAQNPNHTLPSAPAHGLLLHTIRYKVH
jgi:tRNA pseudouridine38-40 synthase